MEKCFEGSEGRDENGGPLKGKKKITEGDSITHLIRNMMVAPMHTITAVSGSRLVISAAENVNVLNALIFACRCAVVAGHLKVFVYGAITSAPVPVCAFFFASLRLLKHTDQAVYVTKNTLAHTQHTNNTTKSLLDDVFDNK